MTGITNLSAQYYDIGQEPSGIKWKQIRTENFSIIYPDYYETNAKRAAFLFEKWRIPVSQSLNVRPPHTPVVMHTGNIYSNAYTVWAPRRLEFLTVPPQDIYPQTWMEQLVLHEYRHIAQISKVNQGFTKALSVLFGQQAAPAIIGMFVPPWFMEGDAVATETALSKTGRGRVSNFSMPLKAQLKEKGTYSYSKAVLGSYKDYVPNEYELGYHIVATAREEFGTKIWDQALERTGSKPFTLNPFSKGIKLVSGTNKKGIYAESMKRLDSLWTASTPIGNLKTIKPAAPRLYTSYTHPFYFNDGYIALKKSLADIPRFVTIDKQGNERVLFTPGYLFDDEVSFNGTHISWVERRPHVRWENRGYSTLLLLNPTSGEIKRLTTRQRLFAPEVSPDNKLVVTSETTETGDHYLTFVNLEGMTTQQIPTPENLFPSSPSWSPDGKEVVLVLTGSLGKRLVIFNIQDSTFHNLTPIVTDELSNPSFSGGSILFSMDIQERSEICRLDPATGELKVLTRSTYGTGYAYTDRESDNNSILLAEYTADGYRMAEADRSDFIDRAIEFNNNNHWPLADRLTQQELTIGEAVELDDNQSIDNYSKAWHLFNFHSWAPAYIDINDQSFRPGASVMSQNLLSTLFVTAGYDFNTDEETGQWRADISWRGWFPEINNSFSYGNRAAYTGSGDTARRFTWKETSWEMSVRQQLNTLSGKYSIGTILEATHQLVNAAHNTSTPHNFREGNIGAVGFRIYSYALHKQAYRDLASPLGLVFDLHYKNSPYGDFRAGKLLSAQSRIYLPGITRNHSIQIYSGYQETTKSADGYRFAGDLSIPAGYHSAMPEKFIRIRPSYSLPLLYPDFNAGTAFYLKRLRGALFYDHAEGMQHNDTQYRSAGADVIADFHLLSLPTPISAGIRSAYLMDIETWNFSLIFSFDLSEY